MPASNNNAAANQGGAKSNTMSSSDAARVQSTQVSHDCTNHLELVKTDRFSQAKGGKDMTADGFAARAQSAGDKNANEKK